VHFNCYITSQELEKEFDYVVVANGTWVEPHKYGIWQQQMTTWLKGGIFEGDFDDCTLELWLDNELTRGVYIYLAPYSKNKAVIAHVVQNIEHTQLDSYWQRFLSSRDILRRYNLLQTWELPHITGRLDMHRVNNVYFIGAAGGSVEPFLGFGQLNAIMTGVMAARSIAQNKDIDFLLKGHISKLNQLSSLRMLLNRATNDQLDKTLSMIKLPGIKNLVYNTDIDVIKLLSKGIKLMGVERQVYGWF
jgi:digeranylgeranylglycerophospholipid reductase